jgi:transposase
MKIAEILDKHLGRHHLHQGLSSGNLALGWIAYILSQSDHRKSAVQDWANALPHTHQSLFGSPLRPHEFSDDRLGLLLNHLAAADWDALESDLFHSCFDVYELPKDVFHVDATTTCGYHTIESDGIMQLGHSKDHRPDLPQLKIIAAVTRPEAFPVSTTLVPGNQTDDVLYWPTIVKVKEKVGGSGLLFCGDCKMAALETRGRIAQARDYYLTALPRTGATAKLLGSWIDTALQKDADGQLQLLYQPGNGSDPPELIGKGYEFDRTLQTEVEGREVTWTERVQIVQSLSQANSQKTNLKKDLQQAVQKLEHLTSAGKGRKVWREEEDLRAAIEAIEKEHGVAGLLEVVVAKESKEKKKYGKPGRPGETAVAEVEVEVRYQIKETRPDEEKIQAREKRLGWRAFVTNASEKRLSLEASVLTYREGGGMERPFHQLKDTPLGIRPLFVRLKDQLVGLTRLLLIALRVLTLLEIVVRAGLEERGEELEGLYEGQKNKKDGRPTAKRLLRAIARLAVTVSRQEMGERQWWYVPALPRLLVRVLDLLGLPTTLYTDLGDPCPRPPHASLAPIVPDSS